MDVIEGRGPAPSLVLQLVHWLPDDSATAAIASGGRQHLGWGVTRHIAADIYDAINQNTRATGHWKRPPDIPAWPRPEREAAEGEKPKATVKQLYALFTQGN